jgi:hypothetical protein
MALTRGTARMGRTSVFGGRASTQEPGEAIAATV